MLMRMTMRGKVLSSSYTMVLLLSVAILLLCFLCSGSHGGPAPIQNKINGVIYVGWGTGEYRGRESGVSDESSWLSWLFFVLCIKHIDGMSNAMGNQSMQLMASALNNTGWASVVVTYYQVWVLGKVSSTSSSDVNDTISLYSPISTPLPLGSSMAWVPVTLTFALLFRYHCCVTMVKLLLLL